MAFKGKMRLVLRGVNNGFCRVYYRHMKALYCFQWAAGDEFEMFYCTSDGEPVAQVRAAPRLNYTLKQLPVEACATSRAFCAWARKYNALEEVAPEPKHGPNGDLHNCLCNACTAGMGDGP